MQSIAYISLMGGLPWGGSEAYWNTQAMASLAQGKQVLVSVYDWGNETHPKIKDLQQNGAQLHLRERFTHDVPLRKKIQRFIKNRVASLDDTWQAVLQFAPDEVIINQGSNIDLLLHHYGLYQRLYVQKIPYTLICHSHCQYSFIPEANIYPRGRQVFQRAKAVLFVSHRQWQLTERMLCTRLDNARIFQNPPNLQEKVYLPYPTGQTTQMAMVGALVSGKGHDTLFEVLAQSQWKNRQWQLNIYGKGYGLAYLKDLAQWLGIEQKVRFCGHVSSATEIWMKNQILLIPSDGEGLPISLVEAAISGRTAVVTDVGGNTEVIVDNQTGFVACAPTPHSFSEALERAWRRREEWGGIGRSLHKKGLSTDG
ncbi:glycosyltransferase family 4 protein [Phaeodactylibacter luteus]|uniref:Glycosyltransferase family 4 protein n=1 Tax=Phaeodactylibacter luteus TaxID=1564516 RepID=A0A5C6RNB7_9BACT|nr:glycosyltransferase family 4 protein [Phaeodactylibacter luteus]TXB63806.1 glycosyltransferase family 4 protein [Phaeodactylibacter luteus]